MSYFFDEWMTFTPKKAVDTTKAGAKIDLKRACDTGAGTKWGRALGGTEVAPKHNVAMSDFRNMRGSRTLTA